ncbi:hypothetical protein TanjilG_05365 [Lupinus angustifolius]|uniref:Uncharacterized protein n=1 Tax=Lupinus angustifolius TaxID=3871 RepID=A0A1J7HPL2_LUPAN|nr:hypothetical protein TanjilG_05365 [Lupinus angustifolius]
MEQEIDELIFNMDSLGTTFPQKRGLSRYYAGKSRSFACIAEVEVQSVEYLKKPEHNKKRKKHSHVKEILNPPPPYPCRGATNCTQFTTPYVNA